MLAAPLKLHCRSVSACLAVGRRAVDAKRKPKTRLVAVGLRSKSNKDLASNDTLGSFASSFKLASWRIHAHARQLVAKSRTLEHR